MSPAGAGLGDFHSEPNPEDGTVTLHCTQCGDKKTFTLIREDGEPSEIGPNLAESYTLTHHCAGTLTL